MGKFEYDPQKHDNPMFKLSLHHFYFVVHDNHILIFKKAVKKNKPQRSEVKQNV